MCFFGDYVLLQPSKQVIEDGHLGFQLEVKLKCGILILLEHEDVTLDFAHSGFGCLAWFCLQLGCKTSN